MLTERDCKMDEKKTAELGALETYGVVLTLTEELLGAASANPDLYKDFIASKAPEPEKAAAEVNTLPPLDVDAEVEKSSTVFHRTADDGTPFLYDYCIKGFFKDVCGALRRVPAMKSSKLTAFKKVIDGLIFPEPRQIILELPEGGEMGICERPLLAQTAKGPRVTLARSETVPTGTILHFNLVLLQASLLPTVREWLAYGRFKGLGQWRNSGKGKFTYTLDGK